MRRLAFILVILSVAGALSVPASADTVQYSLSGTFAPSETSTLLSGPGGNFSISFSLPSTPVPDFSDTSVGDFALNAVPITYAFQCSGCLISTPFVGASEGVVFGTIGADGELIVEFLTLGHDYFFDFLSSQSLFSGSAANPTLLGYGTTNLAATGAFELDSNEFTSIDNASLTAQTVSTPEPSTLALLIASFAGLGSIIVMKRKRA